MHSQIRIMLQHVANNFYEIQLTTIQSVQLEEKSINRFYAPGAYNQKYLVMLRG